MASALDFQPEGGRLKALALRLNPSHVGLLHFVCNFTYVYTHLYTWTERDSVKQSFLSRKHQCHVHSHFGLKLSTFSLKVWHIETNDREATTMSLCFYLIHFGKFGREGNDNMSLHQLK